MSALGSLGHLTVDSLLRKDGLTAQERRVIQDASVVGKTFSLESLAAVSGLTSEQLDHLQAQYHQHMQRVEQRQSIRDRAKALRTEAVKHAHAAIAQRR